MIRALSTPPVVPSGSLAGSEIEAALAERERRWGITRYVVRESHIEAVDGLLAALTRTAT